MTTASSRVWVVGLAITCLMVMCQSEAIHTHNVSTHTLLVPPSSQRAHPHPSTLSPKVPMRRESGSSAYEEAARPHPFSALAANDPATSATPSQMKSKMDLLMRPLTPFKSRAAHTSRPHHAADTAHVSSISLTNSSTAEPHTREHKWGHTVQIQHCKTKEDCNYPSCNDVSCEKCDIWGTNRCSQQEESRCPASTRTWNHDCDHRNQNNEFGGCYFGHYGFYCPCPPGTATWTYEYDEYMEGGGGGYCRPCPAGKFAPSHGAHECTNCPAGKFSPDPGYSRGVYPVYRREDVNIDCDACAAGKYQSEEGSNECTDCEAGKYSDSLGSTACRDCPIKTISPVGSVSISNCSCDAGYSRPQCVQGASCPCFACPAGKYTHEHTITCGGNQPLEAGGCGGGCSPASSTFSDGSGVNYQDDTNCWWLIEAPGARISVSFLSFDTEEGYDFVSIEECGTVHYGASEPTCESRTVIARLSGTRSLELLAASVYSSSTGFLKVTFSSDSSNTRAGFTGTWSVAGGTQGET
jgi:hypothetical protein